MGCNNCKQVEPNESTVVCFTDHRNCTCFCTVFGICTKPHLFNTAGATSHSGLKAIIGGEQQELGATKIQQKFSDIHQELEKRHTNTHLFFIPFILLIVVATGVNLYLANTYKMKCEFTKSCKDPNSTRSTEAQCPSTSDWVVDCCYVYCYDHRESIAGFADWKPGCHPIASINDDIQKNKPFSPECNCVNFKSGRGSRKECGTIKLYGDFNDVPGYYASPDVMRYLTPITTWVLPAIMIIAIILNWRYRINRKKQIIKECLQDWQMLGIKAEYRPRRKHQREHLVLHLPSLAVVPSPSPFQSNPNYGISNTKYGYTYN